MRSTLGLMKRIMGMPFPWNCWVAVLGGVNIAGGLYYWNTQEGKLAIAAIAAAFVVMVAIYSRYGFVRLLGLGHVLFWIPLSIFLGYSLATAPHQGFFQAWIGSVVLLNGVSLVIDVVDVYRYLRGERAPI